MEEGKKILLVEDDSFLREIYSDSLKSKGYDVTTAADGEEAYAKIAQGKWDLVLLDVIMPKMTGIEVLQKLGKENLASYIKHLIFLTNTDSVGDVNKLKDLGFDYLMKSDLTPSIFIDKVKKTLAAGTTT